MFIPSQVYNRTELHQAYGGSRQHGICTLSQHNFIMLFTGGREAEGCYEDKWAEDGLFFYSGQGQVGDMQFTSGNKALRDHSANGDDRNNRRHR